MRVPVCGVEDDNFETNCHFEASKSPTQIDYFASPPTVRGVAVAEAVGPGQSGGQ